jgi:hypothetical protein
MAKGFRIRWRQFTHPLSPAGPSKKQPMRWQATIGHFADEQHQKAAQR